MARRRRAAVREIDPDRKYNDIIVTKFINCLMKQGKKGIAETIFYKSVEEFQNKVNEGSEIENFHKMLGNIMPTLEVKSRRVGGSTYQVPVEVREARRVSLAIRWLIDAAVKRNGHSMIEKLSAEFLDAYNSRGNAYKKKEDTFKMAEANRAFAHYIW